MDCITHKFLFLLFVYVPIRRRISSIWSRSRRAYPLCWDLGRYCPNRLPSHFEKCHRGDYQPVLLISKVNENQGNKISTSKESIRPWTNSCSWSKWKIIMYISDFRVNTSTGLVTGVAAGERDALYGQEPCIVTSQWLCQHGLVPQHPSEVSKTHPEMRTRSGWESRSSDGLWWRGKSKEKKSGTQATKSGSVSGLVTATSINHYPEVIKQVDIDNTISYVKLSDG